MRRGNCLALALRLVADNRPLCREAKEAVPRYSKRPFAASVHPIEIAPVDVVLKRPPVYMQKIHDFLVAKDTDKVVVRFDFSMHADYRFLRVLLRDFRIEGDYVAKKRLRFRFHLADDAADLKAFTLWGVFARDIPWGGVRNGL